MKEKEAFMGIALKEFLKEIKNLGFSGICWGTKSSMFRGSHCTFGFKDEAATVYIKDGRIHIIEYRVSNKKTKLGVNIRKILESKKYLLLNNSIKRLVN